MHLFFVLLVDVPMPYAENLEKLALPQSDDIVKAARNVCYRNSSKGGVIMPLIKMPALSPTMSEGKLSKWLVKVGDTVSPGDVIAEIVSDKAVMEIEALDDGVVTTITVLEGSDGVAVGTVIAEILDEGEESQLSSQNSEEQNEVKIEGLADKGVIENTQPILKDTSEIDMICFRKRINYQIEFLLVHLLNG